MTRTDLQQAFMVALGRATGDYGKARVYRDGLLAGRYGAATAAGTRAAAGGVPYADTDGARPVNRATHERTLRLPLSHPADTLLAAAACCAAAELVRAGDAVLEKKEAEE
jgi:hypothetical protein